MAPLNNENDHPCLFMAPLHGLRHDRLPNHLRLEQACGRYGDINNATCFCISGFNSTGALPALFSHFARRKQFSPDMMIIVENPRCTNTLRITDIHQAVGTELVILKGMAYVLMCGKFDGYRFREHYVTLKGNASTGNNV